MIEKIHIQNFKSIYDLEIEVGKVNLFIGENGSGKSNLLEALVFVSASDLNKLDNEFLFSRGIRVTEPTLMRSAFDDYNEDENIEIVIKYDNLEKEYSFFNRNTNYSMWEDDNANYINNELLNSKLEGNSLIECIAILNTKLFNFVIYSPENTDRKSVV